MKKTALLFGSLALALACAAQVPLSAAANAEAGGYNYARKGDPRAEVLSADEILSAYLKTQGRELLPAEREALAGYPLTLSYSPSVSPESVQTSLSDTLTVTASPYSYTAANGQVVTWSPVTVNGAPLEGGSKVLTPKEGEDYVRVGFETAFSIRKEDAAALFEVPLAAATVAKQKLEREEARYREEVASYPARMQAYEEYLEALEQYEEDAASYPAYLEEVRAYNAAKKRYDDYLAEYNAYLAEKEAYDSYDARLNAYFEALQKYEDYRTARKQYEADYAAYLAGMNSPEGQTVLRQVSYLDAVTTLQETAAGKRSLYNAIMSESVTKVLTENKETIVNRAGAEPLSIDLAERATVALRSDLLPKLAYADSTEQKYTLYVTCYESFVENFHTLLQALDYLYRLPLVRTAIDTNGKLLQYQTLLAQLWLVVNLLSDETLPNYDKAYKKFGAGEPYSFDTNYRISGKPVQDFLKGADFPEDIDGGKPLEGGVPAVAKEPTPPEQVPPPGSAPERPVSPVPPSPEVPCPTPPEQRAEPVPPEAVELPSEPAPYLPTSSETALIEGLEAGLFTHTAEAFSVTVQTETLCYFRNVREIILLFHLSETAEDYALSVRVLRGAGLTGEADGLVPEPKYREGYTCVFSGWVDENGTPFDLNSVDSERDVVHLYPGYTETPNRYPLVWTAEGVRHETDCLFGERPVYDEAAFGVPVRNISPRMARFLGWTDGETLYTGELPAMGEGGAAYTACFEDSLLFTWRMHGEEAVTAAWKGELPVPPSVSPYWTSVLFYRPDGWSPALTEGRGDAVYTAVYTAEPLLGEREEGLYVAEGEVFSADCNLSDGVRIENLLTCAAYAGKGIELRGGGAALIFDEIAVSELQKAGVTTLSASATQTGAGVYRYEVHFYGEGERFPDTSFRFRTSGGFDTRNSYLTRTENGGTMSDVRFSIEDRTLTFTMRPGGYYEIGTKYAVNVLASEFAAVTTSAVLGRAAKGEFVTVTVGGLAAGKLLGEVFVRAEDGSEVPFDEARGGFRMPACAVSVGATFLDALYTITFRSDGKTVATRTCRFGELPEPPAEPFKPSDGEYLYTFAGWDRELVPAEEDAVYEAVYTKSPLPPVPQGDGKLDKIITAVLIVVPILFVLAVGGVVLLVVFRVRKKRSSGAVKEAQSEGEGEQPSPEEPAAPEEDGEENRGQ